MNNQLSIIVENSGLENQESQTLLEKFGSYEQIAQDWKTKAEMIVVTDVSQTAEMEMAKVARKKFSDMRIAIEKTRKELKEQSLRKGQAIDSIAKFLVSLISPIENHLKLQEDFIKIKELKKAEEVRVAAELKAQEELRLKLEAEEKEREKIRLENIRLQEEAKKREAEFAQERAKAEAERVRVELEAKKEREKAEELARIEKAKADKIIAEERAKAEAQQLERERVQKLLDEMIECPNCHHKFNK